MENENRNRIALEGQIIEPEIMPPVSSGKTRVVKGFHPENSAGLLNRETFAFQPAGSKIPLLTLEAATEMKLSVIAGIAENPAPAYAETRRRIHVLAERVFCAEWNDPLNLSFSAKSLARLTAYMDALPKPLGYDYFPVLEREARLIIPQPVEYPIDIAELLQSFFVWRRNCMAFHNQLLIAGLFLLFFYMALRLNYFRPFRYDLVIDALTGALSEPEIRQTVNLLIHRGLD